jgi:hypothetical protein
MASLIAALDKITNLRLGENGHVEHSWAHSNSGNHSSQLIHNMQEKIVQFHFQLVRTDKYQMDSLAGTFRGMLRELSFAREDVPESERIDAICTLYCMLGQTRDIVAGKGEYALSYMMLYELSVYFPELATYALEQFVMVELTNNGFVETVSEDTPHPYGSWKDLKYLAAYCKQKSKRSDHLLIQKCVELTNRQLRKDMVCADDTALSLCAKWVPREGSQFGWFFTVLAKDFFHGAGYLETARDVGAKQKAEKKCYMEYRWLIAGLNKRIDTVQIKQCGGAWAKIDHHKTTSITLSRNKKAFLNLTKNGDQRSECVHRVVCAENFKAYLADQILQGREVKGKRVGMEEFTRQAIDLIHQDISNTQDECDILNSQWRDNGKQTGALRKMIAMVDTSGSMGGDPLHAAIALGIRVAEKSVLGKRVLTFSAVPTWHNLEGADTFVDMVRKTMNASWGMNTNLYAALQLILDALVTNQVSPEEADGLVLAVFSDMQIDEADSTFIEMGSYSNVASRRTNTMQQEIERMYQDAGYKCPHILFWNLRSTDGFPSLSTVKGASMLSGFSPALLNLFCEKGVEALESLTPRAMMMESLAHHRYARLDQFARRFLWGGDDEKSEECRRFLVGMRRSQTV